MKTENKKLFVLSFGFNAIARLDSISIQLSKHCILQPGGLGKADILQ